MWHRSIEEDLKRIFGVSKVLFAALGRGREQDVLFCDVEKVITTIRDGKAKARVYGNISIMGLYEKNRSGFLSKKVQLGDVDLTQKFVFGREESPVSPISAWIYEDKFNVYSIDFMYFYKEQYNTPGGKISAGNFLLNVIKKIMGAKP
jgi:hypothetical protein